MPDSRASQFAELFASIPIDQEVSTSMISGVRIPWRPLDYVGRGANARALLLLKAPRDLLAQSIRLRHLTVDSSVACRISSDGEVTEGTYVIIACDSRDAELLEFFWHSTSAILDSLPKDISPSDVMRCVTAIAELFRQLALPGARAVKGVWGELFVLSRATNTRAWLEAWRLGETDKFDFAFPTARLEVKVTSSERRVHEYSLGQLEPPEGSGGYIASIKLRPSAAGLGVLELAERIATGLHGNTELLQKLWRNVASAIGEDYSDSLGGRFDDHFATQTLRFVTCDRIPRPTLADPRIFNVRFSVDCSEEFDHSNFGIEDIMLASARA